MRRGLILTLLVVVMPLTTVIANEEWQYNGYPMGVNRTSTRVGTLGGSHDLVWDESNVFMYPSTILEWTDLIAVDLGNPTGAFRNSVYASWATESAGTWGLSLSGIQNNQAADFQTPGNFAGVHWGYAYGSGGFGALFNFASNSEKQELAGDVQEEHTYSSMDLRVGSHWAAGPFERVDAAFNFHNHTDDNTEVTKDDTEEYKTSWYGVDLRGTWEWTNKMTFVPAAHYQAISTDVTASDGTTTTTQENTQTYIDVMLGSRYNVAKNATILTGFGYRSLTGDATTTTKATLENSFTDFPYFMVGFEAGVWEWFDFRLGANKGQQTTSNDTSTAEGVLTNTTTASNLNVNYGFGLHFGNFNIDATFNNNFLYNWGWIASGLSNSPVTQVTAGFNWK